MGVGVEVDQGVRGIAGRLADLAHHQLVGAQRMGADNIALHAG